MSATHEDLARRAVALPGWVWTPGILARLGGGASSLRVAHSGGGELRGLTLGGEYVWSDDGVWPDINDPATIGCLMALAGWPSSNMGQRPWVWGRVDGVRYDGVGDSLAEALVVYAEAVGRWPGVRDG